MIRALMHGCCGKMGRVITEICSADPQIEIVAGVDRIKDASQMCIRDRMGSEPVQRDSHVMDFKY